MAAELELGTTRSAILGAVWKAKHLAFSISPHDPWTPPEIRQTIVGNDRKSDLPATVWRTSVAELLETSFPNFLLLHTDECVGRRRGAAIAGCHIAMPGICLSGFISYCATSTTAELCVIRLVLQYLLHLLVLSRAVS